MQVIEPKKRPKSKRSIGKPFYVLAFVAIIGAGGYLGYTKLPSEKTPEKSQTVQNNAVVQSPPKQGVLKTYTGEEFKNLYNSIAYPNTREISEETPITGNPDADAHIRKLAVARGYLPRSAPVSDTFVSVDRVHKLQERASQPWLDMRQTARNEGYMLGLTAGYRSADDQKTIFLNRLAGLSPVMIANGAGDVQINQVLRSTALPGYSRHHTGYTIDIACENDPYPVFEKSKCFTWLSANNYENAKKFGWIPSYPDGAGPQGPDPESWEYVWVGKDILTK